MTKKFDILVLGSGNAGLAAVRAAEAANRSVAVVESFDVGGTCALRGCVPKKVLVAAAEALDVIRRAEKHHISVGEAKVDWSALIAREQSFVEGVTAQFSAGLEKRGVPIIRGRAKFVGSNKVDVDGVVYEGKKVIVATGAAPRKLPIPGFEHAITSDEILTHRELPRSLAFIGAGVIGLELSHVLARAGTKVSLFEVADRPLLQFDQDQVAELVRVSESLGIDFITSAQTKKIEQREGKFMIHYTQDGNEKSLEVDVVANGAGRAPNLDLDLAAAGIKFDGRSLSLSEGMRSLENPDVLFAGDVVPGRPQLSPVATYEGRIVGRNAVEDTEIAPDYRSIPGTVFSIPALASVGMSEAEARAAAPEVVVRINDMREWRSSKTYAEEGAWAKVLIDPISDRILGAHLFGHGAPETIHTFASAIEHGWTTEDIRSRVYAYPTFTSDIKYLL